ncbi:TonB-dependent receptor [Pseudoalteromonas ruthenica]|uniref:Ligand-gated channel protein n=1 Tax=Pseudoalteromonas ruthenica TaxID=151081 RepID=A0A0F4PV92_9GAMM|nr:TonB-dependent receptor [Pseudoalteromonas ruthenica]KJY99024.1 ligand-gated channel protein [Pseudoalteromonas ruthenica]KJY99933.1 ligand-gated channel protein [Pseudoalteromonas ruthenica]TMO85093.1 TonB-dependent receptor [Pseudoalteromonas ruthenica]TMO91754.1 TonB-dependent receptor [Pseudoalteromonas ruthenica]TMP00656.1 TonB-dependent receptor [Pseudoalteromonas ruthenica]
MFKPAPLSLTIAALLSAPNALAGTVTGTVIDPQQQPIENVIVHYHGKQQSVRTNANGEFSITLDAAGELHFSKDDYIDKRVAVNEQDQTVQVNLTPSAIETVVVYASGLDKNNLDMVSPVSVLSGDALRDSAQPTLGETLKGIPGINASYFGPVSSSPIIRGLDGPRVKITQNGLDSSDASRVGPDHAVTTESIAAEQIEVLRGPATLLYGSGAIGGVVNVVDNRIPTNRIEGYEGAAEYSHDTVSTTNTYAGKFAAGHDGFNVHVDGTDRVGHDYETPRFYTQEHEGELEAHDKVDNTFIDSATVNLGTSYVADHWTLGLSYGRIESDYGIPAHSHDHHDHEEHGHDEHGHEDHGHEDEHDGHDEHAGEEQAHNVFARVEQDRWQALASYSFHDSIIETLSVRAGYTDYRHAEVEEQTIGTLFENTTHEARINAKHRVGQWHGTLGYHYTDSDYAASGAEAFTPATETQVHALYLLEEREFGDWTLELGARVEDYSLSSDIAGTSEHEDEHDSHDHEQEHHDEHLEDPELIAYEYDETNMSFSLGGIWQYQEGYSLAVSLSHSERAPLTAELLSNGEHIATSTYELGLAYDIEDGEAHFNGQNVQQEVANNIDVSWRKYIGDFGVNLSVFYNDVENFYYQQDTGLVYEHDEGFIAAQLGDEDAMTVYQYQSQDAELYGFELDMHYQISQQWRIKGFADSVSAKLDNGEYIPRIPAAKLGTQLDYTLQNWDLALKATHYLEQDDIAASETVTDAYTLVDFTVDYNFAVGSFDGVAYMQLNNLTDELGFVHSSFIKEQAPLPGRNLRLGIRAYF